MDTELTDDIRRRQQKSRPRGDAETHIDSRDIADVIAFVISRPTSANEILVRPTAQSLQSSAGRDCVQPPQRPLLTETPPGDVPDRGNTAGT